MLTLRYTDWLAALDSGKFDPLDVNLNVKLVLGNYEPDISHRPTDVDQYIINGVSVIVEDYFSQNSMAAILDQVRERMILGFRSFPDEIAAEINRILSSDGDKVMRENLDRLIRLTEPAGYYWQDLKESGIGYFVFESVKDGCLCFCEEVI